MECAVNLCSVLLMFLRINHDLHNPLSGFRLTLFKVALRTICNVQIFVALEEGEQLVATLHQTDGWHHLLVKVRTSLVPSLSVVCQTKSQVLHLR